MVTPSAPQVRVRVRRETTGVSRCLTLSLLLLSGAACALKFVPIPATPPQPPAPLPEIQPLGVPVPQNLPELLPLDQAAPSPAAAASTSTTSPGPLTGVLSGEPLYAQQWDMQAIHLSEVEAYLNAQHLTPAPVTVAVIDTGFIATPELAGRQVNGYDFVSDPARAGDGNGRDPDASGLGPNAYHAEVVSNIIAAAHDGRGMAGINPQARILSVRVAGVDGLVDPQDLIDGLRWAAGLSVAGAPLNLNPARIINLSLYADFIPLTGCDARIQKAVDEVYAKGVLMVVGAGNDDQDVREYSPAGCRNVLTVTSVTAAGQRPAYANWGLNVGLTAHGGDSAQRLTLSSTLQSSGVMTPEGGTSLAAPHVTGVASLLLGLRPKLTPLQLKDFMLRSAAPFPGGRCDPSPTKRCGRGVLNAEAAIRLLLKTNTGK